MEKGQGKPYFAYHYGAQVAEVRVDTGTGKVEVTNFWAVHNTGKVIFPQGAYGQLYGGITQGLGYALMERVDFDNGYLQATNFDEYLIPTALDVPEIHGAFVESPSLPDPTEQRTSVKQASFRQPQPYSTPSPTPPGDASAACRPISNAC